MGRRLLESRGHFESSLQLFCRVLGRREPDQAMEATSRGRPGKEEGSRPGKGRIRSNS